MYAELVFAGDRDGSFMKGDYHPRVGCVDGYNPFMFSDCRNGYNPTIGRCYNGYFV